MFPRARLGFLTPRPRYQHLHAKPCQRRALYSTTSGVASTSRSAARITAITAGTALLLTTSTVYASSGTDEAELAARPALSSLVRAYAVYSMCSIPALVDAAPGMLAALSSVPGIKQITEAFVRVTFFKQFVGADSAEDAVPLLHELRQGNKGALLAYSVEVDEAEAAGASSARTPAAVDPHKLIVEETLHCIDVAADFEASIHPNQGFAGRRTWIAIKFTAMLPDAQALIALSSFITESRKSLPEATSPDKNIPFPGAPRIEDLDVIMQPSSASLSSSNDNSGLTPAHLHSLREFYEDLRRICGHARQRGVKIIIDAEYSWYQPAIDALTLGLMREFNSLEAPGVEGQIQPTVYGTFQAYLRRTPAQLALALEDARKYKYALGVKLVRGAYHPHELAAHRAKRSASTSISPDDAPPVWSTKKDTDNTYNGCVRLLLAAVKTDVDRCTTGSPPPPPAAGKAARSGIEPGHIQSSWASWFYGQLGWTASPGPSVPFGRDTKSLPKVPSIGILFGTHNWESCALILQELVSVGLAEEDAASPFIGEGVKTGADTAERVAIGQLYGMSDDLTQWVVNRISCETPFVIKYVPYGALAEVMPYLSRRAIENKSVLGGGGAAHERKRAGTEIRHRLFG